MNQLDLPSDEPTTVEDLRARTRRVRALRREMKGPRKVAIPSPPPPSSSPPPPPPPPPAQTVAPVATEEIKPAIEEIPNFLSFKHNGYAWPYHPGEPLISVKAIIQETADYFGIGVSDILSKLRLHKLVDARHVAAYLSKKLTRYSYVHIGRKFGGLDHSTILHAVHRIRAKIDSQDEAIARAVTEIEKRVLAS